MCCPDSQGEGKNESGRAEKIGDGGKKKVSVGQERATFRRHLASVERKKRPLKDKKSLESLRTFGKGAGQTNAKVQKKRKSTQKERGWDGAFKTGGGSTLGGGSKKKTVLRFYVRERV